MMPLVFDAMGPTHTRNRVEAFVHRVKRSREKRLAQIPIPAGTILSPDNGYISRVRKLFAF